MKTEIYGPTRGFGNLKIRFNAESCRADVKASLEKCVPDGLVPHIRKRLRALLGIRARGDLLNYACSWAAMRIFSREVGEFWTEEWQFNNERELELLTITPPTWWVSEYQPILNLAEWRAEASRWLNRLGFTGTAIIEPAPFQNVFHVLGGRGISFHITCVGYTENPYSYRKAVSALLNHLGPGPTKLPSIVSKPISGSLADVRYVAEYSGKLPSQLKKAIGRRDDKGQVLRNGRMSDQLRLRVQEIMSYLALQDVIVARGTTGLLCKRNALHGVGSEAVTRSPNRMTEAELRTLWSAVWKAVKKGTKSIKKERRCDRYTRVRVNRS